MTAKGEMQTAGVWEMLQPLGVCMGWGGSPGDPRGLRAAVLCPCTGGDQCSSMVGPNVPPQDNHPAPTLTQPSGDAGGSRRVWPPAEGGLSSRGLSTLSRPRTQQWFLCTVMG